jgi:hypothetical protein
MRILGGWIWSILLVVRFQEGKLRLCAFVKEKTLLIQLKNYLVSLINPQFDSEQNQDRNE